MDIEDIEKSNEKPEGVEHEFLFAEGKALMPGLYIVATPIGNLRDITLRALDVLRAADVIYCEDTRVTRKLLGMYQIKGHLKSYNDHSDDARRDEICGCVQDGQVVALVSDAGMPLVSDPGYKLVVACREAGVPVTTVPGANAPLSALQISGLPSNQFSFLGFFPVKTKARCAVMDAWKGAPSTLIAFETAPRLLACLRDIDATLGGREVAVVREITKLYEEVRKGTPSDLISHYEEAGLPRGEIVLVIAPPVAEEMSEEAVDELIRNALETMRTKDAAAFVAEKSGLRKSDIYDRALKMGRGES